MKKLYSNPLQSIELKVVDGGKPFCVRMSSKNHIPINFMVFATDKHMAVNMVEQALKQYKKKHTKGSERKYLETLLNYKTEVCEVIANQVFKIGWACNDDI